MDVRLRAAIASEELNVAAFCREHGVSRQTFYAWRRRYRAEGLEGLEPRSRAPKTSPGRKAVQSPVKLVWNLATKVSGVSPSDRSSVRETPGVLFSRREPSSAVTKEA